MGKGVLTRVSNFGRRGAFSFLVAIVCSAASAAPTAWQLVNDGDPTPGTWPMVYDSARSREVLLTEAGQAPQNANAARPPGTWELVGSDWVRRFPPEPTPWYTGACMAFDAARGKTVVFGGLTNTDTWEYDGNAWIQKFPVDHPSARWHCSMVYDASRQVVVLFGGEDPLTTPFTEYGDTWEYDGVDWLQRSFSTSPSARSLVALSYDSARAVTVLFGGQNGAGFFLRDTWEYDGTRWVYKKKNEATGPIVRAGPGVAFDATLGRTVLFGGYNGATTFGDTWEWDGTGWMQVTTPQAPSARHGMRLVWDAQRQRVVGFGGGDASVDGRNDTWEFDGTTWTQIAQSGQPPVRGEAGMTYDPVRDDLVLYGGQDYDYQANYQDTWILTNGQWTRDATAGVTSTGRDTALAFDPTSGEVRGFSGMAPIAGDPPPPDLHTMDSSAQTWSSVPQYPIPGRIGHPLVFAERFGGLTTFSGKECCTLNQAYYLDTDMWTLDSGTGSWQLAASPHVPPARWTHGMAYDSLRGRLVVYGGHPTENGDFQGLADTWIYDGVDWTEVSSGSPPGARYAVSLAYDVSRDRIVLFGDAPAADTRTWEFDGTSWTAIPTTSMPGEMRCWAPLAYDSKRKVIWLFGGQNCQGQGYSNDTWAYGPDPDGDGIVGGLDNCPQVANAGQANLDGDAAGDACDCAVSDPSAWSPPAPVTGLVLSGTGTTTLTWGDQAPSVGPGVLYDVASGDLIQLQQTGSFGGATCIASLSATPSASDGRTPGPASGFWYLARARNVCGIGTYGAASLDGASPCP